MQRGIVSAVDGRRARVKRPDGFVTAWMYISDSVAGLETGDIVFYEPFGNDGLILHAIGGAGLDADTLDGLHAVAFATAAQGAKADAALPLSGGTLIGDLDIGGNALTNHVAITTSNGNTYETYPFGFSYSSIGGVNDEQLYGDDFPGYGLVVTCKRDVYSLTQTLYGANDTFKYYRDYYDGSWNSWRRLTGPPKLLWSGSWAGTPSTLTISGMSNYKLFLVRASELSAYFPVTLSGTQFRGMGGYATSTGVHTIQIYCTVSATVLTWGYMHRFTHLENSSHNASLVYGICSLSEVWGLM